MQTLWQRIVRDNIIPLFLLINLIGVFYFLRPSIGQGPLLVLLLLWDLVCIAVVMRILHRRHLSHAKLKRLLGICALHPRDLLIAAMAFLAVVSIHLSGLVESLAAAMPAIPTYAEHLSATGDPGSFILLALFLLVHAIVAELIYRGVFMSSLLPNKTGAVVVSAALFGVSFWAYGMFGMVQGFMLGLVLGCQYLVSRNTGATAVTHVAFVLLPLAVALI